MTEIINDTFDHPVIRRWAEGKLGYAEGSVASVTFDQDYYSDHCCGGTLGSLTAIANFTDVIPVERPDYSRRSWGKAPADWVATKIEGERSWPLDVEDMGQVLREVLALI